MNEIILALGSNRNRRRNITKAQQLLRRLLPDIVFTKTIKTGAFRIRNEEAENFHIKTVEGAHTASIPFFYNCMAKATTCFSQDELQQKLKAIETTMGDSHENHQAGIVVIDIDLLAYGDTLLKEADWQRPYIQQLSEML